MVEEEINILLQTRNEAYELAKNRHNKTIYLAYDTRNNACKLARDEFNAALQKGELLT